MRPLIAGNWKMHGVATQLYQIETIAASVHGRPPAADVLICVPATLVSRAVQVAAGRIALGGEDCHAEASGPFTGDISAGMLKDAGGDDGDRRPLGAPAASWGDRPDGGREGRGRMARWPLHHRLHR